MNTKELVIELRVPLPEDRVEHAKAIIAADAFEKSLVESAASAFGENGYKLASRTHTTVPGRSGPRNKKAAEPAAVAVAANGTDRTVGKKHQPDQPTA